jgi:membrane-associated phospholipid phosphatase
VYFALSISEHIFPDSPAFGTIGEFGNRSLRALAVGAPTVGVLQIGLGSGRPYTNDSHWHPFEHSNGVSGHAFVGAVPFLTAASMTDSVILKGLLVAGSFGPAWSRIQHDDHYFSQVLLGWAIAYLSVESVNLTEAQARHVRIVPVDLPQGVGLGVQIDY